MKIFNFGSAVFAAFLGSNVVFSNPNIIVNCTILRTNRIPYDVTGSDNNDDSYDRKVSRQKPDWRALPES